MLRKGKGRMQRIRKEQSPAPAYVMPSSYCQPATGPLLSTQGGERGEGRWRHSPRPQHREPQENSDRTDIDLRPIICMLIVRRRRRDEQYSHSRELSKQIFFNPLHTGIRYANVARKRYTITNLRINLHCCVKDDLNREITFLHK